MYATLAALALPAWDVDAAGVALVLFAGAAWAAAAFLCSTAVPVIAGSSVSLNERLSTLLSVVAASLAIAGLAILLI